MIPMRKDSLMRQPIFLVCMALMCATSLYAVTPAVGDEPPNLSVPSWVVNPPETCDLTQLRGDVIVIEEWGMS